ncbi:UPF0481 protein [Senna tora]|uniref:UPF0481 protein n=1 Tax=Senna tora TaxID=362788 RepID=A0A834SV34_9FABA|nr:UPF0481 protein [Senna tora]
MAPDWLAQLREVKQMSRSICPKIQRVAHHLRSRKHFVKLYSPRLVSFGPIHHGEPHLQLGEQYKLMWASTYLGGPNKIPEHLHQKIVEKINELKLLYSEDAIRHLDDENLARVLFMDGCALLQILDKFDLMNPEVLNVKVDQLVLVNQDMLLLENQLPFQLLKLLSPHNDNELTKMMVRFFNCHHLPSGDYDVVSLLPHPPHLLDQLRRIVLCDFQPQQNGNDNIITYRNIKELKAAGIRVKRCESKCPLNITFSTSFWFGGELRIPKIVVDDTIAPTYLNLIAYEMCPDFENKYEISSYLEFLDSLIDHPDDVMELRSAEVLHNGLGSDEEVAKLFNTISADLVPDTAIYACVRAQIEKHYANIYKTWYAQACYTYFSTPWTVIAVVAAFLALVLTFVQTWFAIFPAK